MHPARRMARIVEIMHHGKWQAIAIGKPFDRRTRLRCDEIDDRIIGLSMCLLADITSKELRRIDDAVQFLKPRFRSRYQPGR